LTDRFLDELLAIGFSNNRALKIIKTKTKTLEKKELSC
jgi:hypothetical protein